MRPTTAAAFSLDFATDPAAFLADSGSFLAADPVVSTVVTTQVHRALDQRAAGIEPAPGDWWLTVRDRSGGVVGAAMRTARAAPYPPFLLPMPDDAATALARALHARGEEVAGLNGALPAVERCAAELARLRGGRFEVAEHTRLHDLREPVAPARVPGGLVRATERDLPLVTDWFAAFAGDAAEQAGRPRETALHHPPEPAELLRRVRAGLVWFWVDEKGEPVHLTGANPPAFGVARIGPVYTPPAQRGRGWAGNAVSAVSRRLRAEGARVCLFTDQANPTSNRLYAGLGFQPVVDMANLLLVD